MVTAHRTRKEAFLASLGMSYIALKVANRPDEFDRTVDRLARCLSGKIGSQMRLRIARQAVMEGMVDSCPSCSGTGEVRAYEDTEGTQRMKECPECGGHGKRRYSNQERIEALQIAPGDLVWCERALSEALGYLAAGEKEAILTARRLLERY
jgi:hypothetical protein